MIMKERSFTYLLSLLIVALFAINSTAQAQEKFRNPFLRPVIENVINFQTKKTELANSFYSSTLIGGMGEVTSGNEDNIVVIWPNASNSDDIATPLSNIQQEEHDKAKLNSSIDVVASTRKRFSLSSKIKIYPNPANSFVNINAQDVGPLTLTLYNVVGQKVFSQNYQALNRVTLPVSQYPSGIYLLELNAQGQYHTQKIQVR